ncbi:MAG: diacylglycerol/lipid kinase family protein [Sphingomicrobium sp.]
MPTTLPKQAILIVNAASGNGAESLEPTAAALREAGVDLLDCIAIENPKRCQQVVADAIPRAPMVIVGGGDGSISSVVDCFVGRDTVFGILPLGTANSFARTLGIPLDLEGAVDVLANGRRKRIDLGQIDGDYFANTAVIGLSPLIAHTVPDKLKRVLGRGAYLVWALRWAVRFKPFRLVIEMGEATHRFWATEVRIANGRHFGGVELVDDAEVDSGELVVQAVTGRSKLSLARSWLAALFRIRDDAGEVKEFRGREFRIETRPPRHVAIDGEPSTRTPIEVKVALGAIEVAVPVDPEV